MWLVTRTGIYDQGVVLVAADEAEAVAFCEKWAPDPDGYHNWRIDERMVGAVEWHSLTPLSGRPIQVDRTYLADPEATDG